MIAMAKETWMKPLVLMLPLLIFNGPLRQLGQVYKNGALVQFNPY